MNEVEFKPLVTNQEQLEILKHTRKVTHFCGGSKDMDELVKNGLMEYAGKKSFVPDPYYKLTKEGKKYLMGITQHENTQLKSMMDQMAKAIHYPECWDTVSYPNILDAVREIGCNPCDCTKLNQKPED